MGKKKRGNKKKKSGRGSGGGDKPSASSSGGGKIDARRVERQSLSLSENDLAAPLMGSATSPCSDEEFMRLMMTLPRFDEERTASYADDSRRPAEVNYLFQFLDAAGALGRNNPAFADRLIGDLARMGKKEENHECWICLSDDVDDSGRSPVRDCSCRGDGLGYAHIDCIKTYARRASLDMNEGLSDKLLPVDEKFESRRFNVHWEKCSLCCQSYQHMLAKELADTLLQFIAEKFSTGPPVTSYKIPSLDGSVDKERYQDACRMKICAITTMDYQSPELRQEGEETARKLLAMAYTDDDPHPITVALGLKKIGFFLGASEDTYKEGIMFYEKAIEQYESIGRESSIAIAKSNIERIRIEYEGQGQMSEEEQLKNDCDSYNYFVKNEGYGEESMMGIKAGLRYAHSLTTLGHGIEGERLAIKTVAICAQILGKKHGITCEGKETVAYCRARRVKLLPERLGDAVAIRCEDGGRKIVVVDKERRSKTGPSKSVIFWNGTPVICHSLKDSTSCLNGKPGDARNYNKEDGTYTVHFEDTNLKPVAIKSENLSIAFELPDPPKKEP